MVPELPFDAVPVESSIFPVSPETPEFVVIRATFPLDVVRPTPDFNEMEPPVPAAAAPPFMKMPPPRSYIFAPAALPPVNSMAPPSPPGSPLLLPYPPVILTKPPSCASAVLSPAANSILPPSPEVASPTETTTSPPLALLDIPVARIISPDFIYDRPVDKINAPLTPFISYELDVIR